jgi:leader peptidase (prepilin peptidase) / N-methyltransferase
VELTSTPETTTAGVPSPGALDRIRALPRSWKVAVAAIDALLVVGCFVRFGFGGRAVVDSVFASVLVLLAAIDLDCRRIPNMIVLPATAGLLAAQIALYPEHALEWVLAGFLAALFLFLPLLVVPMGMGMGDVKLAALMGVVLGRSVAGAIFIGLIAGALFSIGVLVREGLKARKKAIAYGPFLVFGALVVLVLGGH